MRLSLVRRMQHALYVILLENDVTSEYDNNNVKILPNVEILIDVLIKISINY